MQFDEVYSMSENVFGSQPERILINFCAYIDKSKPVLDIGAGQGRNSFFLAKKGFSVDAIDPSGIAVGTILSISKKENIKINAYQTDFSKFAAGNKPYSAVLIFGLLQILDWDSIKLLLDKINYWTVTGSLIFVTAFLTGDNSYKKYQEKWVREGKASFTGGKGNYRTFLEPDEILKVFDNYKAIYHWEGLGPKHRHGNGPLQQHHLVEYVGVK